MDGWPDVKNALRDTSTPDERTRVRIRTSHVAWMHAAHLPAKEVRGPTALVASPTVIAVPVSTSTVSDCSHERATPVLTYLVVLLPMQMHRKEVG